ncbi:MAG: site-specific integrase [Verrucomicrobia bacterium]|nr:site-specific integrase [Verrucomicrobiota bacterium]MBU4428977.1 site-specific integrase [Verrucomicrobiota bacterium]MCG2680914.1 site-specific integrase [Kiritimatiellia bacterium]
MKKRKRRKIPTVFQSGIAIREIRPGYFMADVQRGKKRDRAFFKDIDAAKTHCDILARKIQNEGASALDLTPGQRNDARDAIKILAGEAKLTVAADFWRSHHPGADAVTVEALTAQFMESLRKRNARQSTIAERRYKLDRLCSDLGKRPVTAITEADIVAWLDDKGVQGQTRDGYRRCFNALFNIGLKRDLLIKNPCANIERAVQDEIAPEFFSKKDTQAIMTAAEGAAPEIVPYLALQFFGGLRPGEAAGLDWSKIDLGERTLTIDAITSKKRRRRIITINDTLTAWLARYGKIAGRIGRATKEQTAFSLKKVKKAAGVAWIQDGPRHTFATMFYATTPDAPALAAQMGNTAGVVFENYRGLATRSDAEHYWQIRPAAKANNVIQFKTA